MAVIVGEDIGAAYKTNLLLIKEKDTINSNKKAISDSIKLLYFLTAYQEWSEENKTI